MNERIKELAEQAGLVNTWGGWVSTQEKHAEGVSDEFLERFAELVRQEEREACAKLCDELACRYTWIDEGYQAADEIAAAIRGRTE
jgi:hypothetical protein